MTAKGTLLVRNPERTIVVPPPLSTEEALTRLHQEPIPEALQPERLLRAQFIGLRNRINGAHFQAFLYRHRLNQLKIWERNATEPLAKLVSLRGLLDARLLTDINGREDDIQARFTVLEEHLGRGGVPITYRDLSSGDRTEQTIRQGSLISIGEMDFDTFSFVATIRTEEKDQAFIYLRPQLIRMGPTPDQQIISF